jgi:rhodanese-related sulfurtransferase
LQQIRFNAGDIIIRQDEPGDYYYIVKKGRAIISRRPSPTAKEIKLAQISDLDTFGEDALISGIPRTVSITAITDMSLLRLGKEQFIELIKQPTLKYIDFDELQGFLSEDAELVDVRSPDEFKKGHLARSINVPFFSMRMYLKTLNKSHPIILVCKDGRISESAAFILLQHKFNALILKGGIDRMTPDQLKAEPASFNIDDGTETGNFSESSKENTSLQLETMSQTEDQATEFSQILQQLKAKCKKLESENMTLELKCSSLSRQLESAKLELDKLKIN